MIRCVVVDDEPLAREILELYVSHNEDLQLVGVCKSAEEVVVLLNKENVDVLFLDILMPGMSGMQLLKTLENPPLVVFTTAYSQYAVEGFEVGAVDYLMKPISPKRFNAAVEKIKDKVLLRKLTETSTNTTSHIFVRADYQDIKIMLNDILYIEGLKDYVKIVTTDKRIITLTNIKGIMTKLPPNDFIRVHKSFIVSKKKIDTIKSGALLIGEKEIPIGLTYKENFKKIMGLEE
ncbi:MAG: response regulator transcription factor [Bacteroidales bacterium]|nr:response regulator transcription factor [Bacteroidales bacterium]